MDSTKRFFINNIRGTGGPSVFGSRLKEALTQAGWKWDRLVPSVSFIFSAGLLRPFCRNILRLDGLYFDSANTLGDSDRKNRPIRRAYRKADGLIFQSEFDRRLFKVFMDEASCPDIIIPNGAPEIFTPKGGGFDYGFKKTLLCSAFWRAHKRLDCIIKGFIEYGNIDTGLVVLGEVAKRPIEHPRIKYMGHISPNALPQYLRGADAFIHLSWLDHCPNTVVEAICCGLPVLCTHNGGTKELVKDNGIVMKCESDYDFKRVDLYNPPKCDNKIVAAGIEKILAWNKPVDSSELHMDSIASRYVEFAGELIEH